MPIATGSQILASDALSLGIAIYGDGSDGDVTIAVNTDLARDMFYGNLTVNAGITLNTKGYRVFVKGTLTNNGIISRNGNAGAPGTAALYGDGGTLLAAASLGASGAGGHGKTVNATDRNGGGGGGGGGVVLICAKSIVNTGGIISANGGAGGAGASVDNVSGANVAAVAGDSMTASLGGAGGTGGATGPAAGGTVTAPTTAQGGFRSLPMAILLKDETTKVNGGAGGGGGGTSTSPTQGGGGGGGGGGTLVIIYNTLAVGTETATGGAAGAGGGAAAVAGSAGTVIKLANA